VVGLQTEQREIQATEAETAQQEAPQPDQSVGSLLKTERERLGLSREQITERTRMRTQVLEAIENEDWASLPPAVFVRGFLRSYAKVLGVPQDTVMRLYARSAPAERPGPAPHPEPPETRGRTAMRVVLILVILAVVYGLWQFYPSLRGHQGVRDTEPRDQEAALQTIPVDKERSPVPLQPAVPSPSPFRVVEEPPKQEPAPVKGAGRETSSIPKEIETPASDQVGDEGWLSLTATVRERTWLRITIDGKEEKEYLFHPGSRPQWKGRKSFYMLIGNAAGIEFELNGNKVGSLGSSGQVIRLTLPKGVEEPERND